MFTTDSWRKIKKQTVIVLKDEQAILDSMEAGKGVDGLEYIVTEVQKIKEQNGSCEWIILYLDNPKDDSVKLVVKIVDDEIDLKVYFEDKDSFTPGNREDVIDRGDFWLFKEPKDVEDFKLEELEYSSEIDWNFEEEGDVIFSLKSQGILFGEEYNKSSREVFATCAEYQSEVDCCNPELFVFEVEEVNSKGKLGEKGGYIQYWFGCPISENDLEVIGY